ncbi:MAG: helix-turn-helix domain-containing protein, partial [Candidatus Neomarinimicrobiota bacterium]
ILLKKNAKNMREKIQNKSSESTFSKNKYIEHSPAFRQKVVESALKIGVTETSRLFNVTRGFIYTWKKRYRAGLGFNNQGKKPPLTDSEKKYIINSASTSKLYNPKKLKKIFSLPYSLDTIHRTLVQGNLPLQQPFLIHYNCKHCKNHLNAIQIYYGRLMNPQCPACPQQLNYKTHWQLPFYNPSKKDYYINHGKLYQNEGSEFTQKILPFLEIDENLTALFIIHPNPRPKYKYHLIKVFQNNDPITFCGEKYNFNRAYRIVTAAERLVTVDKICHRCQPRAIKQFHKKKNLDPVYTFSKKTKQQEDLEIMWDYFMYQQVKIVCKIHLIHPSTFYEIKKRNQDIYTTLEQLVNQKRK